MLMSELRTEESPIVSIETRREEPSAMRLAREVLGVIPEEFLALEADDAEEIRFRVRGSRGSWKIRTIVFGRESLERLDRDPLRSVKVEYLQRELLRVAPRRQIWGYPRPLSVR
jgi:hypothetical protein